MRIHHPTYNQPTYKLEQVPGGPFSPQNMAKIIALALVLGTFIGFPRRILLSSFQLQAVAPDGTWPDLVTHNQQQLVSQLRQSAA